MTEIWRVLSALWRLLVEHTPEFKLSLVWNLLIAITPAIAILCLFYEQDRGKHKSHGARLRVFCLGLTTVIPAILLEIWAGRLIEGSLPDVKEMLAEQMDLARLISAFLLGFVLSATIEELVKIYYLSFVKQLKVVNNRQAVIVYSLLLGLAFASAENISYVLAFHDDLPSIGVGRALLALPMHGVCAVLMGYFVGEAEFTQPQEKPLLYFRAWAIATLIHGSYNTMLFAKLPFSWLVAVLILGVSLVVALVLCWQLRQSQPTPAESLNPPRVTTPSAGPQQQLAHKVSVLLNRSLKEKGITAKVTPDGDRHLEILLLSSKSVPNKIADWIYQGLLNLDLSAIQSVTVISRQFGREAPQWQQQLPIAAPAVEVRSPRHPVSQPLAQKPLNHGGFSVMSVLFGFLADICSTNVVLFLVGFSLRVFSTTQDISEEAFEQLLQAPGMDWFVLGLGFLCTALGGFLAAQLAGKYELRHALGSGILSMFHGIALYSALDSSASAWFDAIAIFLTLPAALLGGILRQWLRYFQSRRPAASMPSHA